MVVEDLRQDEVHPRSNSCRYYHVNRTTIAANSVHDGSQMVTPIFCQNPVDRAEKVPCVRQFLPAPLDACVWARERIAA